MTIAGSTMRVRVIGELDVGADLKVGPYTKVGAHDDGLPDAPRYTPAGSEVTGPIVLRL